MREIKFRSWNERKKEMITPYFFVNDENFITQYGSCKPDSVMQFTGLQDKNGADVYEGDVIRFLDAVDCSTESGYDFDEIMNIGKVYFCNQEHGWDLTNREQDKEDVFVSEDIEVVGNIHENPELLELSNE